MDKKEPKCKACGKTLTQANESPTCTETNSYEHDIPGYRMVVTLEGVDQ